MQRADSGNGYGEDVKLSGSREFSVVIPTLQRSAELGPLVEQLARHPRVLEVLVINNAPEPLSWDSPRVRVLQQEQNIYVNPAWNLGAATAKGRLLAIVNDDIDMPDALLDTMAGLLHRPWIGLVGTDIHLTAGRRRVRLATEAHITLGYGVFMAMRRKDYVPIPDDLKIWGGDNLLFWSARRLPVVILGSGITTELGTTSASPEFQQMRQDELNRTNELVGAWHRRRFWHPLATAVERFRRRRR